MLLYLLSVEIGFTPIKKEINKVVTLLQIWNHVMCCMLSLITLIKSEKLLRKTDSKILY